MRAAALAVIALLSSTALNAANNPLGDKIVDGHGKPFLSPRGGAATLADLGLGAVPQGNNKPVRVLPWSKMPGEISQMAYVGDRLFFSTVKGKIWEYTPQGKRRLPALLDIDALRPAFSINASYSGKGLRGFAFHPEFNTNGLLYTLHLEIGAREQATHGALDSDTQAVLAEWHMNKTPGAAPEFRSVIRVGYRSTEHIGGQIGFNPVAKPGDADYGMLYAAYGEGGGACGWSDKCIDQFHYGQDFSTIQSSIIRINPQRSAKQPYTIPADNPFVGRNDPDNKIADEIYAKGFRNPATLMFDQETGQLFSGDISQNSIEEINLVEKGKNYGWGIREGTWLFTDLTDSNNKLRYIPLGDGSDVTAKSATYAGKDAAGKPVMFNNVKRLGSGFTSPVAQFTHRENGGVAAVVTGTVYRGTEVPELKGLFLFGNLSRDNIYYVHQEELVNDESPAAVFELKLLNEKGEPSSFGAIVMGSKSVVDSDFVSEKKDPGLDPGKNRTNIRFGQDRLGNIYIISKHNNMIYQLRSPL